MNKAQRCGNAWPAWRVMTPARGWEESKEDKAGKVFEGSMRRSWKGHLGCWNFTKVILMVAWRKAWVQKHGVTTARDKANAE